MTLQKFTRWDLIPNVMIFGRGAFVRWSGNEGGNLNGTSVFTKETPREVSCPFYYVKTQKEDLCLGTRKQALTRLQICQCLDFGLLSLQTC